VAPLWCEDFIDIVIPTGTELQNSGNVFSIKAHMANKNRISFHYVDLKENFSQSP
jgi:hypothetical protein